MEFKTFGLHPDLQKGINEVGYINCMPVQEQVLSVAFGGQDLYVQSQTGTGKTAAFLVVIFQRLLTEQILTKRKALIMAPTRELAVQIEEEAQALGKYLPFKTGSFYGGVGYTQQEKLLRENVQIMVGTPGRVLDQNKKGLMNLMDITFLVIDEADRMFDMGFYPDLRNLIRLVPPADRRQTMLFSATLNSWVKNLAWEYTKTPFEIEIKPDVITVEEITQILYHVALKEKMPLLLGILKHQQPESAIIFCNTKKTTEIIAKRLRINGIVCEFIIGDLPQTKRLKIIDDVKAGKIKILVATDVAARGLDIESLSMVINYDLPTEAENYVHRIGRTARAGKTGKAISLASEQDVYELPAIEKYIGKKIPSQVATATEEPDEKLFTEDKSAGLYIETEYYEERHSHNTSRGNTRRSVYTKPDNNRHINKRHDINSNITKKHDINRNQFNKTKKKPPFQTRHTTSDIPENTQDLSNLSIEERMAFYRKKYGGETKHDRKQNTTHQASGSKGKQNKINKKFNRTTETIKVETVTDQKLQNTKPDKKGIFAKLKGLFVKK